MEYTVQYRVMASGGFNERYITIPDAVADDDAIQQAMDDHSTLNGGDFKVIN